MSRTVVCYTDSTGFGGAEIAMLNLIEGLDRRVWRPVLFHHTSPGLSPLVTRARDLEIETDIFESLPGHWDVAWLREFRRRIRRHGARLFHAHLQWPLASTYGIVSAWLARVPVVATQHLFGEIETPRSRRMQKAVSGAVDVYIAVSEHLASELYPRIIHPGKKIRVIRNSVRDVRATGTEAAAVLRRALGAGGERPIVLTLARLEKQKGIRYLIEAAALVPDALFLVAGEGPDRAELEGLSRSAGVADRFLFLGYRRDGRELLAACDLFVLPSLFEGLPLSVLEAMAAGKPVVATKVGGTDEAVEHDVTGLLVTPRDSAALASAIREVLSRTQLAQRLGEAGEARARRDFNPRIMVERTVGIYEELLGRSYVSGFQTGDSTWA